MKLSFAKLSIPNKVFLLAIIILILLSSNGCRPMYEDILKNKTATNQGYLASSGINETNPNNISKTDSKSKVSSISSNDSVSIGQNDGSTKIKVGKHKVIISQQLPTSQPSIPLLKVKSENFNEKDILKMFEMENKKLSTKYDNKTGSTEFIAKTSQGKTVLLESLTITKYGYLLYRCDHGDCMPSDSCDDPGIEENKAKQVAENFIVKHGGMPADAILDSTNPQQEGFYISGNIKKRVVHQYRFLYISSKKDNSYGYPIEGANHISLVVDKHGILLYERFWRHPVKISGKPQKVVNARQALLVGLNMLDKTKWAPWKIKTHSSLISQDQFEDFEDLNPRKNQSKDYIKVYNMTLVYFNPNPCDKVDVIKPAWKISFVNSRIVCYVDAYSGIPIGAGEDNYLSFNNRPQPASCYPLH